MKLFDLEAKKFAAKALKENFDYDFNPRNLGKIQTQVMLQKVKKTLAETKKTPDFYQTQSKSSYLKLLFMEQALSDHYNELNRVKTKVIIENEEVEKSQVILAAQDMVDSIQKMLEDVGQMQVKELPALVSSIESEMDVAKAQTFNEQVSQQLTTLSEALKASYDGVKGALNSLTGMEGAADMAFAQGGEEAGMAGADAGAEIATDMGAETPTEPKISPETPELPAMSGAGRAKR